MQKQHAQMTKAHVAAEEHLSKVTMDEASVEKVVRDTPTWYALLNTRSARDQCAAVIQIRRAGATSLHQIASQRRLTSDGERHSRTFAVVRADDAQIDPRRSHAGSVRILVRYERMPYAVLSRLNSWAE
jgi:hypothetical protein